MSRPTLISQIEAKIGSGKGAAYDQKLKVVKLKSMAETLLFIQKHDFADFNALADYADAASSRTKELTAKIKAAESRMAEIAVLKTHIINYAKTRDIYTAYERLQKLLMSLYENLADGIIDRDEYARLKQNYAGRCAECEKQMETLQEAITQIKEHGGEHRDWMAQFREHLNITELERSIVVELIDRMPGLRH